MRLFDQLNAKDIECRVARCTEKGVQLLLYKTARVDAKMLDEKIGPYNWQCEFKCIDGKMYCGIGIKAESGEWIWKWDCGSESNMEAEKGQASDAFKRAGFKWGIGAELYSSPFIWIGNGMVEIKEGKCNEKFDVTEIGYDADGEISDLQISTKRGVVFTMKGKPTAPKVETAAYEPPPLKKGLEGMTVFCQSCGKDIKPTQGKDGKTISVEDLVRLSGTKYKKNLCADCMKNQEAYDKAKNAAVNNG